MTNPAYVPPPAPPAPPNVFHRNRYRFTTGLRAGELARIRDDDGHPILTYRSFAGVAGIVAATVSGIVIIAGIAATAFLFNEEAPLRAIAALALTILFAGLITMLTPRVHVTLYENDTPALTIAQQSLFPASYVVTTSDGAHLAVLRKHALGRLGRNRWTIVNGTTTGHAVEESLGRALTRKMLGKFNRRYESNFKIEYSGLDAGMILRRGADADVLEVHNEVLDKRVAVALATLVLGAEP